MRPSSPSRVAARGAVFILLWALSIPIQLMGNSPSDPKYLIDTWGADEGLPQSGALAITQTPDGYLWFGTLGGLVRFDGVNFKVFDPSNTPELPSPAIVNMYLDRSGRLWVSTSRGIVYVKDGKWQSFRENSGWNGNYVRFFAETPSGQLYVTTFNNKLFMFRGNWFEELPLPPADPQLGFIPYIDEAGNLCVVNPQFIGKLVDHKWQETISAPALLKQEVPKFRQLITAGTSQDGGLWLATNSRLLKYRAGKLQSEIRAPWPMQDFWKLREDSSGTVWIASWHAGLYRYSPGGEWHHYSTLDGLSDNFVRDVFEDREGNLWVGTDNGGLLRFKRRNFLNWGSAQGLPATEVDSVAVADGGRVFIGTRGHGVLSITGSKVIPVVLPRELKSPSDTVLSLLFDRKRRLWFGTLQDGLYLVESGIEERSSPDSRRHSRPVLIERGPIYSLLEDSRGTIWIGTDGSVIGFDGKEFKKYPIGRTERVERVFCLAEDPSTGTLWAGSATSGVFRLQGDHFVPEPAAKELANEPIAFLTVDRPGSLWITTEENGIARLWNGHLTRFSEQQGIPPRYLGAILQDGQGNFWLGSNRGILRISPSEMEAISSGRKSTLAVQVFDRSDGLTTVDCVVGGLHTSVKDSDGRLWFLTAKGAVMVDPANLRLNTTPPLLAIENVQIDGKSAGLFRPFLTSAAPASSSITIPAGSHRLAISYTALSFAAPTKVRFRYTLGGAGGQWIDVADHRVIYFQDLKPGSYELRIEAANNDGIWSNAAALAQIRWQSHFYQTAWFRALCVLALGFALMAAFRLRVHHLRTRERQLESLVSQRTGQLQDEVEERKRAEQALSRARDELEDRVQLRTTELAAANARLEADLRERQRIEEQLRRSEEKFSRAFHSSPAAMSISTLDEGLVIDVNDAFLKLFGFQRDEVVGRRATELQTWLQSPSRNEVVAMLRQQRTIRGMESRFQSKSGKIFDALFSGELIPFGGEDCFLGVVLDFTEQKRLEEQLRQSQKMEALGQLAGGVAHDFNNLLEVIIGYSEILTDAKEFGARQQGYIHQVQKAAQRAAALTRQLLAFSRKQVLQPTLLDLNATVSDVEKLLRRLIGENIEFVTKMDPSLGSVRADRGQMEQVILNLCVNARDAMPAGGRLVIETANADFDDALAGGYPEAVPGPYVMLSVSDTGVGMDATTKAHIFEPFFTTKERGKGTGLGLSTVYGIVKQSGGHIWVYSEVGRGTTFKLFLPRIAGPVVQSEPPRVHSHAAGGRETILLVEDEESVRCLVQDALSARGYRVIAAANAEQALEISKTHPKPIHILVTDMVMPGKGGVELARQLLHVRGSLKVLFLSGYIDDQVPGVEWGASFLQKPFTLNALTGKVRELLDTLPSRV